MALLATGAALVGPGRSPAAPPVAPAVPPAPETRAQGYRFVVEQVQQQQSQQWEFPPPNAPDAGIGEATGRQYIYFRLAVTPPDPKLLPNLEGLASRVAGSTGQGKVVVFTPYPMDEAPVAGGIWRTQLMAQEVELGVTRIKGLQGSLIVYPHARVVSFDFPLARAPATQKVDGFRATLKEVRQRPGSVAVTIEAEWPAAVTVTRSNPDSPNGVSATTRAGGILFPNGGNTNTVERGGLVVRTHNLTFLDLKEPPQAIRLEALVRSGTPRRIAFNLPEIVLPSALNLDRDPDSAEVGPLSPGDALFARAGGRLVIPLRGSAAQGSLLVGLARAEGAPRWYLPVLEAPDRAALSNVAPGRYRVTAIWSGPGGRRPTLRTELEVAAGKTAQTPPLELGGTP
jgi:hypothetical protein